MLKWDALLEEALLNRENKALEKLVIVISSNYFQLEFKHHAYFNSRLRSTGGRYHLSSHDIDINPKIMEKYGIDELIATIKHELCHYHLHLMGKGYQHRDIDFKSLLKKTGGSRYVKNLSENKSYFKHCYKCSNCHHLFYRQRKIDTQKYVCGNCSGTLKKVI